MSEGTSLINAPKESEDDLDVYAKKKMGHNTTTHMYKEIPDKALETFSFGSVHFLLSGDAYDQLDPKAHSFAQVR